MKPVAVVNWEKHALTLCAKHGKLTLTDLSLQGLQTSHLVKLKSIDQSKLRFYPYDGAGDHALYLPEAKTIVLRRSDFLRLHDYTQQHGPLRDFCLIRVPMKTGLRPGEIRGLRWENVDFQKQTLNVYDIKKHESLPVPMDLATADYLRELSSGQNEGFVIDRNPKSCGWRNRIGQMLSLENLEHILKKWARLAGCETWQRMRLYDLRHFFAANWAYPADKSKPPGNLHALSKILRHTTMWNTQTYLSRLVFYEDLQAEYNRLQGWPFASSPVPGVPAVGNELFDTNCRECTRLPTCKFVDQVMQNPWATGCKYCDKTLQKEKLNHG